MPRAVLAPCAAALARAEHGAVLAALAALAELAATARRRARVLRTSPPPGRPLPELVLGCFIAWDAEVRAWQRAAPA